VFIFAFLPVVLIGYYALNKLRLVFAAKSWLLVSSLFFYGWWKTSYVPLLVFSIFVNYILANQMLAQTKRIKNPISSRSLVCFGIVFNVLLLGYFKYVDFFIGNFNFFIGTELDFLKVALPLGISFFTLQQIAFLIDAYEGLGEEQSFIDYALFVSFFPQLIAGPIVHHRQMMPQFQKIRNKVFHPRNFAIGLFIFTAGLFKKAVIADSFSVWATRGFDEWQVLTFFEAWSTSICYTLQIYYDFSGYTDMAIGIGLMFNILLPHNFNSPYKATSIVDFWKRWHITLTSFVTTYIYTPIVRFFRKITFGKTMFAIFLAMFVSGFWHGAAWSFVAWGTMHGLALILNHWWRKRNLPMPSWLGWFLTFNFVNASFVVFRAKDLGDALKVLKGMVGLSGILLPEFLFRQVGFLRGVGVTFGDVFLVHPQNLWVASGSGKSPSV
jgi:D-alanyl-lipoteichoic acid acyltransferase DltB (MBOAT superfamily)